MSASIVDCAGKIRECEEIIATIPASTLKIKAGSVQHLLVNNTEILDGGSCNIKLVMLLSVYYCFIIELYAFSGIREIQASGDQDKLQNVPLLVNQLERNLLEVANLSRICTYTICLFNLHYFRISCQVVRIYKDL